MEFTLVNIAAVLAFLIGVMSIVAGTAVINGKKMNYHIINWLPVFNLALGLISAFFTASLIWQRNQIALPAAVTTLASYSTVLIILKSRYRGIVAKQSLVATLFRMIVWLTIILLISL
jgi:hypothetical protein